MGLWQLFEMVSILRSGFSPTLLFLKDSNMSIIISLNAFDVALMFFFTIKREKKKKKKNERAFSSSSVTL